MAHNLGVCMHMCVCACGYNVFIIIVYTCGAYVRVQTMAAIVCMWRSGVGGRKGMASGDRGAVDKE